MFLANWNNCRLGQVWWESWIEEMYLETFLRQLLQTRCAHTRIKGVSRYKKIMLRMCDDDVKKCVQSEDILTRLTGGSVIYASFWRLRLCMCNGGNVVNLQRGQQFFF